MEFAENSIIVKTGSLPGKTLAIFAGVHGNEKVGVMALERAIQAWTITKGTVYFVIANPEAVKQDVRFVEKNLNRLFVKTNTGMSIEDLRAQELMSILDTCDALLDLHASNSRVTQPFIITDPSSFETAKVFDIDLISYGWGELEQGSTDDYMASQGKIGICIECGSVYEVEKNFPLAVDCIEKFLSHFGAIEAHISLPSHQQTYVKVTRIGTKETDRFSFVKEFNDFDLLPEGQVFAQDGEKKYRAGSGEYIIFPRPAKPIGGEVFIIGKKTV